jgi:hypothetical protein
MREVRIELTSEWLCGDDRGPELAEHASRFLNMVGATEIVIRTDAAALDVRFLAPAKINTAGLAAALGPVLTLLARRRMPASRNGPDS